MTKKSWGILAIGLFGTLAACSTSTWLKKDISQGELLYRQKCRSCHHLVKPEKLSDEEWALEMEDMSRKSGLNEQESQLIWEYLASHN